MDELKNVKIQKDAWKWLKEKAFSREESIQQQLDKIMVKAMKSDGYKFKREGK